MYPRAAFPRTPVAPLHAEPRVASPQTSQALFGHLLLVLGAEGDWRRVRTARDGYEGWTHAGYLDEFDPPHLAEDVVAEPDLFGPYADRRWPDTSDGPPDGGGAGPPEDADPLLSLGCTIETRGRRLRLPLGAVVHHRSAMHVLEGRLAERAEFAGAGAAVLATAQRYFYATSYQWGGVTPWGADCSGMVQTVHALHGVDLPRDAWQQAQTGTDAGTDLTAHAAGDLLFFSDRDDRRITHVGLATGDGALCHLALGRGGWSLDPLAAPEDAYAERLARQLVTARRVLNP